MIRLSHRSALLWLAEHLRLGTWDLLKAWSGAADEQDLRIIELTDYPKLHCPFVRKTYEVNKDDWRKHGRELQLRKPEVYLVTPEINPYSGFCLYLLN